MNVGFPDAIRLGKLNFGEYVLVEGKKVDKATRGVIKGVLNLHFVRPLFAAREKWRFTAWNLYFFFSLTPP